MPVVSKMIQATAAASLLAASCEAGATQHRGSAAVTPLQKVSQLLSEMAAKGKQEKHTEEVEFSEFQQWGDSTRDSAKKAIAEGEARIVQLEADIAKANADAATAGQEAEDYSASADADTVELEKATAVRKSEKADYDASYADLSESIDAIERAIQVLKTREADVPQSLIQVKNSRALPQEAKSAIEALLAMKNGQAPEANAYEFQSGSVVDMLEKLRLKFQDQRLALQKAEMAAKANYQVLAQKLTDSIKDSKTRSSDRTATKASRLDDAAKAKGDLGVTQTAKAEDEKELSETLASCSSRSQEFEKNQNVRSGEIKAIEQALEILNSDAVKGNAETYLPTLAQTGEKTAFVQLRSNSQEVDQNRQKAIEFLQDKAKSLGSRYLALAATHVAEDPFAKVKTMIKDLIVKLMEEANSEADHNAYCTTELATNKQTRENKQAEIDELNAGLEAKTAESAQLATQLSELSDAVAEVKAQQAEATSMRQKEKATNAQTVADAKEAQVAVERATKILKDFYASAADGSAAEPAFVQGTLDQQMSEASKAPYKGMQSSNGGVIGFLEVILSDFARLETETSSSESTAQEAYEKFMAEADQDVAVKETEIKHKDGAKMDTDAAIASLKKELELTQGELNAANDYYQKLKPDCVDKGLSYEERVQKREEEIQSLKEALKILTQEDLA